MTLMTSINLALLTVINILIGGSILYPPALFTAIWSALLAALYLSGNFFYSISSETLLIYFLGALSFSVGGLLHCPYVPLKKYFDLTQPRVTNQFVNRFLNMSLVILVILLPVYLKKLFELSTLSGLDNFWIGIRVQTSSGIKGEENLGVLNYLVSFAFFITLVAFYEKSSSRWAKVRAILIIIITFIYQIATVGRTSVTLILLGLIGIAFIMARKIKLRIVFVGIFLFLVIFSGTAFLLNKGGDIDLSITENVSSLSKTIQMYTLSSIVAFDNIVTESPPKTLGLLTFRFFINLANALGSRIDLPSPVLDYTITPNLTNIYTIYYPYYMDFGMFGIMMIMFLLGILITKIYKLAICGNLLAIILYGICFGSIILTNLGDPFIVAFSFWIQAIFWISVIYLFPRLTANKLTM
jgi:oligosaccharide repeat unit polymerase